MPGPLSADQGRRIDPGKTPHEKCQQRERCTGPGCRVSTGKTHAKRTGDLSARARAERAKFQAAIEAAEQENAA